MATAAKERKLSRLGSKGSGGGGGGSPGSGARGYRAAAPPPPQRRLFAASFAFLCLGVVAFAAAHVIGASFRPVLRTAWPSATLNAVSSERREQEGGVVGADAVLPSPSSVEIRHAISSPDHVLLVLRRPSSLPTSGQLQCIYSPPNSSQLHRPALSVASLPGEPLHVRCPPGPPGAAVSLPRSPPVLPFQWDRLAYTALLDRQDNSTVVFAKGMGLRPGRLGMSSRYQCVFSWDLLRPKLVVTAPVVSAAQEIFRCKTPVRLLRGLRRVAGGDNGPTFVSVRTKGLGSSTLPSVAHPQLLPRYRKRQRKAHSMCVCTMLRNQARFLQEWIVYHSRIGVKQWFIYDNNSDDDIEQVLDSMDTSKYNVTRYRWPWIKSQEAGFAHCVLRARGSCQWVGFIDIDEFLYFPGNATLQDVLRNYSSRPQIGELRTTCHSFGPSGRTKIPKKGVMTAYTCRLAAPERHKSIVRPDALNPSLMNVVHHFHLREGMRYVNIGQGVMLINHYKYQVWDVFKDKFSGRVATYVADWQDEENVGSRDRAPGLGTKPVEPVDWPSRFCEVQDTGLKDFVLKVFPDPDTGHLPW